MQNAHIQQPTTATQTIAVRFARPGDVDGIAALVNDYARRGDLLPRSPQAVYETLDDWLVAATEDGEVLGCVSLLPYPAGLVEVRSLAVKPNTQGLGIGSRLMHALIEEAKRRQVPTLFALTRVVGFFQRFGFTVTTRDRFPQKVWRDCLQCPLLHNCDETAVVLEIDSEMGRG